MSMRTVVMMPLQRNKITLLEFAASFLQQNQSKAANCYFFQPTVVRSIKHQNTMKIITPSSFCCSTCTADKAKKSIIFKRGHFKVLIAVFASASTGANSLFLPLTTSHLNTSFIHNISSSLQTAVRGTSSTTTAPAFSSSNTLSMSLRAWTCHGRSQRDMAGIIKSTPVKEALLRVDRSNYVENPSDAYMDAPQRIGYDQTISAPHMHSHALEEIVPSLTKISRRLEQAQMEVSGADGVSPGSPPTSSSSDELKILDVGCGSGYLTAAFGRLIDRGSQGPVHPLAKGRVWGIDVIPELVSLSRRNIMKADSDLLDSGTVTLAIADGWRGLPDEGPFHAIHVGAAAENFPVDLMMQLYPDGGVMVVPVGPVNGIQNLYRVERLRVSDQYRREDFHVQNLLGVRYVPLVQSQRP